MAEETPATGTEEEPSTTTEQNGTGTGTDPTAELEKWKTLARKHEKNAKENAAAAKRLAEIDEANKSEAEKSAERLAAAEERASRAETDLIRMEVAAAKGLTPAQAKRLVGASREELEADADELVATFTPASNGSTNGSGEQPKTNIRPTPNLRRQVPVPKADAEDAGAGMNDWLRAQAGR